MMAAPPLSWTLVATRVCWLAAAVLVTLFAAREFRGVRDTRGGRDS